MTKNAKAVLLTVLGVGVAGGFILVFVIAVIGIGLIAAADDEENGNRKAAANESKNSRKRVVAEPEAPAGEIAPELVGTWYRSTGGGETDFTGKSRYRSHRSYMYRIAADGAVEYTFERETLTIMQCEIRERKTADGKAATAGDTLVINFGEADHAESNSCEGGETVEKTLPAETVRLNYWIKTAGDRTQFCFDEAEGEACYEKKD